MLIGEIFFPFAAMLLYILSLISIGQLVYQHHKFDTITNFMLALLYGSILISFIIFGLAEFRLLNNQSFIVIWIGLLTSFLFTFNTMLTQCKQIVDTLNHNLCQHDKYRIVFIATTALLIIVLFLMAGTPPRHADAMRYHLAQLKDIVQNHGIVYRPYIHYQFPLSFSFAFLPLYWLMGGVAIKFTVAVFFLLSQLATFSIGRAIGVRSLRLVFFILFIIPISYSEAHEVLNSWIVVFSLLIGILLLAQRPVIRGAIYPAFVAFGFALGVKYQAILFLPWYIILGYPLIRGAKIQDQFLIIAKAGVLTVFTLSPSYLSHAIHLGNPFWPLLIDYFPSVDPYFDEVLRNFIKNRQPYGHSLSSLGYSTKQLFFFPQIPFILWPLAFVSAIFIRHTTLKPLIGLSSFFFTWWILSPSYLPRTGIFILPLVVLIVVAGFDYCRQHGISLFAHTYRFLGISFSMVAILFFGYYSNFYLTYYLHQDKNRYHQFTWFYHSIQWLNEHLPSNARILTLLPTGQTYYIQREIFRAEPELTATIHWANLNNLAELEQLLNNLHIDYLFYAKPIDTRSKAGEKANQLLTELEQSGKTPVIYQHTEKLVDSRIKNHFRLVDVVITQWKKHEKTNYRQAS